MKVYFWALYSVPLIYVSILVPVPCCFDYCIFVVQSEVWEGYASSFVLFSQDCFGSLGSFVAPYKFQDYLFQFCEKCHGYFDKDHIKSIDCFGQCGHFHSINSSNPRHGISFHLFVFCFIFLSFSLLWLTSLVLFSRQSLMLVSASL